MDEDWSSVVGDVYREAQDQMRLARELIEQRRGVLFDNAEEALKFGDEMHCTFRVYSAMSHQYLYVNHLGELLTKSAWVTMYKNVLIFSENERITVAIPERFEDIADARVGGEQTDGLRQPLFFRNYFVPKGFFDEGRGLFNKAKPFKWFARETGADTSYIYTFLKHLAGPNYIYLLAWLREKMMEPTRKTEVVPVFVSKAQGTGKTTFGEVICKALFEDENVLVTDQYDSGARFNADYADALIVCLEEKMQDDKRNDISTIKSRVTATTVRKEEKGVDPTYQDSYTDFIITSNGEVPLKFDSAEQRRFMVIEVDDRFTRADPLADEVFTKLYGYTGAGEKVGPGLKGDSQTIEQFKHELLKNAPARDTSPRDFVRTEAYSRCFSMPRTNETVEIEAVLKSIAPFIKASLEAKYIVSTVSIPDEEGTEITSVLDGICPIEGFIYKTKWHGEPDRVGVNRLLTFVDNFNRKPFAHSQIDRGIIEAKKWLQEDYGLVVCQLNKPPGSGFPGVETRYKFSPTVWFTQYEQPAPLAAEPTPTPVSRPPDTYRGAGRPPVALDDEIIAPTLDNVLEERKGTVVRYNEKTFLPDVNGAFETLNELRPGARNRSKENAQYLDTFLLECDEPSTTATYYEQAFLERTNERRVDAEYLYRKRLIPQKHVMNRLIEAGIVRRAVYSGSKSIHLLVRVFPSPETLDERRWLFAYLCKTLGNSSVVFDASVGDPCRLTRAPIIRERESAIADTDRVAVGNQRLLYEDKNAVYHLDWRPMYAAWQRRKKSVYEQKGKHMLPSKEIYQDAARAFLEGTFFSDGKWDGRRQECFFPMYRIVRALGYTYQQVWDELNEQVKTYKKVDERQYWIDREHCRLIEEIEGDLE